jgi:TonB-dependent starch-binding outer membrane protein SusC
MIKRSALIFQITIFFEFVCLITAYGQDSINIQTKDRNIDPTGLATVIKANDFNRGVTLSPWELIQGKLTGITISSDNGEPGADYTVTNLRNINFSGLSSPYVIVDGIPLEYTPLTLNPGDISEFVFLKDGVSAGIYGGQAANGVLIVNTRNCSDSLKIHYSGSFSVSEVQKRFDIYNPWEYAKAFMSYYGSTLDPFEFFGTAATNWQDKVFQTAVGQDHYLSISGKVSIIPVRVSFGKTIQDGVIKTSTFDRTTLGLCLSPSFLKNHLSFKINVNGMMKKNRKAYQNVTEHIFIANPTFPVYATDGDFYFDPDKQGNLNPLAELMQTTDKVKSDSWDGSIGMEYRFHFIEGLKFKINLGRNYYRNTENYTIDTAAAWFANGSGYINRLNDTITSNYYDVRLSYSKDIPAFSSRIEVLAGLSDSRMRKDYYKFRSDQAISWWSMEDGWYKSRHESYFGSLLFSLKERYNLIFDLRKDGYDLYPEANKWKVFPSVLLSWNASEESFLKNISAISNLNVYAGYSLSGNYKERDLTGMSITYPSLNFKQESIYSFNAGISFGFLNDNLKGTVEYYDKTAKDLSYLLYNVGTVRSHGYEVTIKDCLLSRRDIHWEIGANFSYNKNKVEKIIGSGIYLESEDQRALFAFVKGQPAYSFRNYKQVYNAEGYPVFGQYADVDGNGAVNPYDIYYSGTPYPRILVGLNSDFRYKNWTFAFSGRLSCGNKVNNKESYYSSYSRLKYFNCSKILDESKLAYTDYSYTDYYLENASFFRMDYLSLGYDVRLKALGKTCINISAFLQNAFVLTKYRGQDPEVVGGVSDFAYPRPRTVSFRITADF